MGAIAKVRVELLGDASSLQKAFKSAGGSASSFGKSLGRVAKGAAIAAGAAGIGALAVTLKQGIAEFSEAAKASAQTAAVLKSTGGVARVTAKHVDELSERLMNQSGVDDELIKSGQNVLLTFTKIRNAAGEGNRIFDQATQATLNLSVALGKDMQSSAILVGKALNDPVKGMTALSRAGVQLDADQQKLIKTMVASGDVMGAQKLILAELTTQFGGSAAALGDTLPGKLNILKESFNNLAGTIVEKMAPSLEKVVDGANDFIERFSNAKTASDKFAVVVDQIKRVADKAWQALSDAVKQIDWGQVASTVMEGMKSSAEKGYTALKNALSKIDWRKLGNDLGKNLETTMDQISKAIKSHNWNTDGQGIGKGLQNGLAGVDWGNVIMAELRLIDAWLKAQVYVMWGFGVGIGKALMQGIGAGLDALWGWIQAKVSALVDAIPGWMRGMLGIASPSKVMADLVGKPIVQGIVSGMESQKLMLAAASTKIADDTKQAFIDKVRDAQRDIKDAFQSWGDAAIAAYDDNWDRLQKKIQDKRTKKSLAGDVDAAKKDLADAKLGLKVSGIMNEGESLEDWSARNKEARDRVMEAQKTLDDALQAQRDFAAEQKHAKDRERFIADVAQLQTDGATLVMKHGENHTAILKKIRSFEKSYKLHGKGLGDALAEGLRDAMGNVVDAANELARAIARLLNVRGKVASAVDDAKGPPPSGKAAGGPVRAGTGYIVGEKGPEYFVPSMSGHIIPNAGSGTATAMSGGGGMTVNVYLPEYLGSSQDVAYRIRDEIIKINKRNGLPA